ncbi:fumarylacetoacetate hydrolase family protein [Nocardiopsis protaetiae]|uniref:fumarylacetoacetate hydrolase family protein n=1 Tax=Nocardiopsis protaetiae TaxID=3382270 RepID=UPI00387A91E2
MRIVNAAGRLGLRTPAGVLDVESASGGLFSADIQQVYDRWDEFTAWAATVPESTARPVADDELLAPVPRPRQVFGIGLNYRRHAIESGMEVPTDSLVVFTKFPSCVTGPSAVIDLPPGSVDYETELVAVIGRHAHRVPRERAWEHVAGLTMGQDLSERELQLRPPSPQFNLGKSFPGFAPIGPELVTPDEFDDPDDLEIGCLLNGEQMQKSRTDDLVFPIPRIIEFLSSVLPLLPGDLIFTGTPAGIGWARDPRRLLSDGDELVTYGEGIGTLRNRFRAGDR